jgi:hypothetical protein
MAVRSIPRQFPNNPGLERRSFTPNGADPEHPAPFRSIRVNASVLDAKAERHDNDRVLARSGVMH